MKVYVQTSTSKEWSGTHWQPKQRLKTIGCKVLLDKAQLNATCDSTP